MTSKSKILLGLEQVLISTHSDGAVSIKIPTAFSNDNYNSFKRSKTIPIEASMKDAAGLLALIYLLDHLNTDVYLFEDWSFSLSLTYMPNARQDRTTGDDKFYTPNTLKTLCKLLSSYDRVKVIYVTDVHSNVPSVLLDNLHEEDHLASFILSVPFETIDKVDYFISPDLGAYKKVKKIAENYNLPYLVAQKERDPIKHEIELSLNYDVDLTGKTVMICDDIIDYGTSINELSKILRTKYKVKEVLVYASHGILPINLRLEVPSRFSFVLEHVSEVYLHSLWEDQMYSDVPEQVQFLYKF